MSILKFRRMIQFTKFWYLSQMPHMQIAQMIPGLCITITSITIIFTACTYKVGIWFKQARLCKIQGLLKTYTVVFND